MSVINLANGSSSLILNGRAITDLAEGDFITLTPANAITSHVNSMDGGVTIAKRLDGEVYDLVVRVQKRSQSDVYLNSEAKKNTATVFSGTLKEKFTRDGIAGVDSWALDSGSFTTPPTETRNNQDGNAVLEYTIRFRTCRRSI